MHTPRIVGAAAAAVVALLLAEQQHAAPAATPRAAARTPASADGHYVLVVEGDRDGLDVTFASRKDAAWAGAPKGFTSSWRLLVVDDAGAELAEVPLDVRPFATGVNSKGKPAVVHGCVVVDSKIGMLVNAPRYAQAASYRFSRTDAAGVVTQLGEVTANQVRDLSGEPR